MGSVILRTSVSDSHKNAGASNIVPALARSLLVFRGNSAMMWREARQYAPD